MLDGEVADLFTESMRVAVSSAVDEGGPAEVPSAQTLVDDELGHCDHRGDADAGGDQDHGSVTRLVENELAARRHRFHAKPLIRMVMKKGRDQRVTAFAFDR